MNPRDDKGHFVPLDCPNPLCGGRLQRNEMYGHEIWTCDGLVDPEDDHKELQACEFSHRPGDPYQPTY
jgi:hypothetical protein